MKTVFTLIICFCQLAAMTQVTATWKGGCPGQESTWHCPKNWSTNRTPNEFNIVHIPNVSSGSSCFPIIKGDAGNVNALLVESGAKLTIAPSGSLFVEQPESTLIFGEVTKTGKFAILPKMPEPTRSRLANNSLATKSKNFNLMRSATDMLGGL